MKKSNAAIILAILAIGSLSLVPNFAVAESTQVEQTWVRMWGKIQLWGSAPVNGFIWAHARMVDANGTDREFAMAHAVWSSSPRHINCTDPPTSNFTYTFYAARLVNSSAIELNYGGYDFYISGLWNVDRVTVEYYIDDSGNLVRYVLTIEQIVKDAEGELRVFSNWNQFELSITNIDLLSGVVLGHMVGNMQIQIGDFNGNDKVDIWDLVHVAKAYGSMPALGNYNLEMDFNFDYKVDIGDLTTLAANIAA